MNTNQLKTSLKFVLMKEDTVSKIFTELAKKSGEGVINPKNFILVPKSRRTSDVSFTAGSKAQFNELVQQEQIALDTLIKNLNCDTVELREKLFADKPLMKQKEMPIENKYALSSTFNMNAHSLWRADLDEDTSGNILK